MMIAHTMRYIALFKPYGVLSCFTHELQQGERPKRTLSEFGLPPGVYAAGRLDVDSEGLLLLSDDGRFIHRVTHPRYKQPKTYYVLVEGVPTTDKLAQLRRGVIVKGYRTQPCEVELLSNPPALPPREKPVTPHGPTAWLVLTLREGKKRQVRHMTAAVGLPTLRLMRIQIGCVRLDGLLPGQWRDLTPAEVRGLLRPPRQTASAAGPQRAPHHARQHGKS